MKPNRKLAETTTPDGECLALYEHDGSFCIRLSNEELMHSRASASERQLGQLATSQLTSHANPTVLIGGLGLGFTLRSVLDTLGPEARVQVAELIPAVVDWNREFLTGLNGQLLNDPRVEMVVADVWDVLIQAGRAQDHAVLLDIDNGPTGMVQKKNGRVYDHEGLQRIASALKPGGRAAIWSARPDHGFAQRLSSAGFAVKTVPAKLYEQAKRCAYTIFVADK